MKRSPTITSPYAPDLAEVKRWMESMVKAMKVVELVTAVLALLTRMRDLNTELTKRPAEQRSKRPPSEKLRRVEQQLVLNFGELTEAASVEQPKAPEKKRHGSRRGRHPRRAALPKHLDRVPELNQVPPDMRICPLCGAEMTTVGHSTCETLDVRPAELYVRQRLDERVACPNDDTIVTASTPPAIVEGGKLGDRLIIDALADKYLSAAASAMSCRTHCGVARRWVLHNAQRQRRRCLDRCRTPRRRQVLRRSSLGSRASSSFPPPTLSSRESVRFMTRGQLCGQRSMSCGRSPCGRRDSSPMHVPGAFRSEWAL